MIFRFQNPELLWLLLLLPLFAVLRGRRGARASLRFPAVGLARQVSAFVRSRPGRFVANFHYAALTLFIIALARPQTGTETSEIESSGVDIMLAIDVSGSMWAHDFEVGGIRQDRLTVVRNVIRDFIKRRPNDRIGMVVFATEPYLVSPLTLNHEWLQQRLDDLFIGIIDESRTAIGSAIGTSTNRLRELEAKSKVLVLLTDGVNNSGQLDPVPAAEAAAAFGIRIYTVGVGRAGLVPFPIIDRDGQPRRNRDGRVMLEQRPSEIDLETLKAIAEKSGGRYFHATETKELEAIYDEIDALERTDVKFTFKRLYSDVFWMPLAAGLLLLLVDVALRNTRYRRIP